MTAPKVLISDKMDPKAAAIFKERGIDVDVITGKTKDELIAMIGSSLVLPVITSTSMPRSLKIAAALGSILSLMRTLGAVILCLRIPAMAGIFGGMGKWAPAFAGAQKSQAESSA